MKSFLSGVILTLVIVVPPIVLWLRRENRRLAADHRRRLDIDQELARLSGELAHEIKNPLSTIKVNLKLAQEALDEIEPDGAAARAARKWWCWSDTRSVSVGSTPAVCCLAASGSSGSSAGRGGKRPSARPTT